MFTLNSTKRNPLRIELEILRAENRLGATQVLTQRLVRCFLVVTVGWACVRVRNRWARLEQPFLLGLLVSKVFYS